MTRDSTYWRKTRQLTALFLIVWAIVIFIVSWFADVLNAYQFLGFPLGFYMGAQGQMLIFLALIWGYNRAMDRLDAEHGNEDR